MSKFKKNINPEKAGHRLRSVFSLMQRAWQVILALL